MKPRQDLIATWKLLKLSLFWVSFEIRQLPCHGCTTVYHEPYWFRAFAVKLVDQVVEALVELLWVDPQTRQDWSFLTCIAHNFASKTQDTAGQLRLPGGVQVGFQSKCLRRCWRYEFGRCCFFGIETSNSVNIILPHTHNSDYFFETSPHLHNDSKWLRGWSWLNTLPNDSNTTMSVSKNHLHDISRGTASDLCRRGNRNAMCICFEVSEGTDLSRLTASPFSQKLVVGQAFG